MTGVQTCALPIYRDSIRCRHRGGVNTLGDTVNEASAVCIVGYVAFYRWILCCIGCACVAGLVVNFFATYGCWGFERHAFRQQSLQAHEGACRVCNATLIKTDKVNKAKAFLGLIRVYLCLSVAKNSTKQQLFVLLVLPH